MRPVRLLDGSGRVLKALTYLVDRNHDQYAGGLSLEEQIRIVLGGKGQAGGNVEYVMKTLRHLEESGVHDDLLASIAAHLIEPTLTSHGRADPAITNCPRCYKKTWMPAQGRA